jgi:hypothetical protein
MGKIDANMKRGKEKVGNFTEMVRKQERYIYNYVERVK